MITKGVMVLVALCSCAAVSAEPAGQFYSGGNGSVPYSGSDGGTAYSVAGYYGVSITPTTARQRDARFRLVAEVFPAEVIRMQTMDPPDALKLYERLEKKARWSRVEKDG